MAGCTAPAQVAGAGASSVVDPLASKIILRSRMPTFVVDGRDIQALENSIHGRGGRGTVIEPEDESEAIERGEA